MSGLSVSLTFLLSCERASLFVNAVEVEKWARLPEFENKEDFLYASSRNNGIEYDLRALLKAFQCQELSYFRDWDEIINRPPWTVALMGPTLGNAIAGFNRFMSSLRENPARCASVLSGRSSEYEIAEAVRMPAPATFHEAHKRYEQYQRSSDGGDDGWSLVSFLYAHTLLLETAYSRNLSAGYALWLY